MVKIQERLIRKQYKRGRRQYVYKQLFLPFPAKCNRVLEPFLKKKFHFAIGVKDAVINISLTEQKDGTHENKLNHQNA